MRKIKSILEVRSFYYTIIILTLILNSEIRATLYEPQKNSDKLARHDLKRKLVVITFPN